MSVPDRVKNKMKELGLSGVNVPKRTPNHKTKSHVVMASEGGKYKVVRFGQQGVKGAGKSPTTAKDKARKRSYYARHNAQGKPTTKLSAKYWSHKVKWQRGNKPMGILSGARKAAKAAKKAKKGTQKIFSDKFVSQLDEGQAPSRGVLDVEAGKAGKVTSGKKSMATMRDEGRNPQRAKKEVELEKKDPVEYKRMIERENKKVSEKAAAAQGKKQGEKTPVSLAGEDGKISVGGKSKLKDSDMMVGNTTNGVTKDGEVIGNPTDNQIKMVIRNLEARERLSTEAKRNLAKLKRMTQSQKQDVALRKMERKMYDTGKDRPRFNQGGLAKPKPSQTGLKKLPTAVRNKMGYMKRGGLVKTGHTDMRKGGLFYK